MAHRKVTVTIPSPTGVPKDAVQNTFHFTTPTATGTPSTTAELEAIRDAIVGFYDTPHDANPYLAGTGSLRLTIMFNGLTISPTLVIKIYHCETEIAVGASPEPIITYTVSITAFAGTGAPLPTEVAACLSFRSTIDTSLPAARQRGRIFLGPLDGNCATVTANHVVVAPGVRAVMCAAGAYLRGFATAGIDWVVWSHTALQAFPVTAGWADNAFDTQRRRGTAATTRTLW